MPVFDVDPDLDILSLAEAKQALNIPDANTDADTELAQVITAASRFVDGVYGPVVQRTVTDERHYGAGASLYLEQRPVVSLTSVTEYNGGTGTVLTAETDDAAGTYRVDLVDGRLFRRSNWGTYSFGSQSVKVTYVAGRYANTASVGAGFKEAAVVALIHFWQHRGANSGAGSFGGDGAPFGGVPFSSAKLREKLVSLFPAEWTGPAVA